jgi:hypothetical protein
VMAAKNPLDISDVETQLSTAMGRLQRLEDEHAVVATLYRYSHGINAKNRELWLDVFTPDGYWAARQSPEGEWRFEVRGHEELRRWYDDHAQSWPAGAEAHTMSSPLVVLADGAASARSYYLTLLRTDRGPGLRSTGLYEDELIRCSDGQWRIKERRATGNISYAGYGA